MPFGMPSFGPSAIAAYTQAGARNPVDICYSGVYHWWYTIGMRTNNDLFVGAMFLLLVAAVNAVRRVAAFATPVSAPVLGLVLKNAESRLNHHLAGLIGV